MNGSVSGSAPALSPSAGREVAAALREPWDGSRATERRSGDRYSRRVALLKRLLPILGMALLALVAIWPRLGPLLESVRLAVPLIDLREAGELRMLNARYAGLDRFNRPYLVTAVVGRQVPNRDDLMALEQPKAEMTMHNGAVVVVSSATALYQAQPQLLDLFDDVNLVHQDGTRFMTKTAHLDVAASTAEGHDPVSGEGPSGALTAQGFRITDKGNTVIFYGKSHVVLKGSRSSQTAAMTPPRLPAEVEEAVARIEAMAATQPPIDWIGAIDPTTALNLEEPAQSPGPVGQSPAIAKSDAKPPAQGPQEAR